MRSNASISDLRKHGDELVDRAARGEAITITRARKPVAALRAVSREHLAVESLLARWRRLPAVDPVALRAEVDQVLDAPVGAAPPTTGGSRSSAT
jgi:prevent-host-death family protein